MKWERMWRTQKERRRIWVAKMEESDVVALVEFVFVVRRWTLLGAYAGVGVVVE
jgi:hypothetical protein